MKYTITKHAFANFIFALLLSACNLGVSAPENGSDMATAAALTVEAALTSSAQESPPAGAPGFSYTPTPNRIAIDGTTAEPTSTTCEERFNIILWERDGVTYDKSEVDKPLDPNQGFEMSWVIQNTGTCTWTDGYTMNFDSGERITPTDSFNPIPQGQSVPPGAEMAFSVPMAAPAQVGKFETTFRMDNASGARVLFVGVLTTVGKETTQVDGLAAPGDLFYTYNCSGGITNIIVTWTDNADNESGYRIYRDGIPLVDLPAGATSYSDTVSASGTYQYTVAAFNKQGESTGKVNAVTSNCK